MSSSLSKKVTTIAASCGEVVCQLKAYETKMPKQNQDNVNIAQAMHVLLKYLQ